MFTSPAWRQFIFRPLRHISVGMFAVAIGTALSACGGGGAHTGSAAPAGVPVLPPASAPTGVSVLPPASAPTGVFVLPPASPPPGVPVDIAHKAFDDVRAQTSPNPGLTAPSNAVAVSIAFTLPVIDVNASSQSRVRRRMAGATNYGGFTSPAASATINLTVTPYGAASAGPYTGACTPDGTGTAGTCSVSFTAAPGATTFSGTIIELGNVIARFSQVQIVQPNSANAINFTARPVVASVGIALSAPTTYLNTTLNQTLPAVIAGTPYDVPLVVNAYDANGNIIAGTTNYVDVNGKPFSIILSTVDNQNGGRGSAALTGGNRIAAPGQGPPKLHYDGNWLDYTTVTARATSSAVNMSGATATLSTVPHATEYQAAGTPVGIIAGPDGNVWFAEYSDNAIAKITPDGVITTYPCTPCNGPYFMAIGADGDIWYTEYFGDYIDQVTTAGVSSRVLPISGSGVRIRSGPDGNLWYSTDGYTGGGTVIGKVSTNGTALGTFNMGSGIRALGFGPEGALWYASKNTTAVGRLSITGASLGTTTVTNLGGGSDGLVTGPDGNIWVTNFGANRLNKITPSGSVTSITLQTGAQPRDIVVGPDGKLWFTERGKNTIGVIAPNATTPTEFTTANGISATSGPVGITVGPDGNIWFTEYTTEMIAKFVW